MGSNFASKGFYEKENIVENETYNGWTNYATWRVNLELFDGMDNCTGWDAATCKDIAEEIIFYQDASENTLMESYARAFLNSVNWYEIAEHLKED